MDGDVGLIVEQVAQRMGDLGGVDQVGRDLVEHRLEGVVIVLVDEDHVCVGLLQLAGSADPAEAAAQDQNPRSVCAVACIAGGPPRLPQPSLPAPSRSSRWSPTRSALAIAVSPGLTAPMLGKKLVSTT